MESSPQKKTAAGGDKARPKRAGRHFRIVLSISILGASAALLWAGSNRSHEVVGEDAEELAELLGFVPFELISDRQLIIDATFTGVVRRGEWLISTYDRSQPRKKQACPT
ncbi:MAG: hypothetical protein V2A76_17385 [Planctomycetota bacterium]